MMELFSLLLHPTRFQLSVQGSMLIVQLNLGSRGELLLLQFERLQRKLMSDLLTSSSTEQTVEKQKEQKRDRINTRTNQNSFHAFLSLHASSGL